jgi:peptidase M23-like protein
MRSYWSLRLSEVAFFSLLFFSGNAFAQFSPDKTILPRPAGSNYLFPINPGKTSIITGTMGELRNTHFHAGLDIDTPGVGYPVVSVQDGYISRATCTTSGYGNVLHITHPDGNTTIYAHLDEFKGAVGEFVRQQRYLRKVSEIDLTFSPNQYKVSRGELIALSGNTGGSGGPHLHFEVRNNSNEAINPLIYDFEEVKDHVAPQVFKVALKTMDAQSRINDQFGRFEFSVVRNGNSYSLPHPILASGRIGVEILAHDRMENSRFRYGINYIDMQVNDQVVFKQTIEKINLSESRRILTLMDYKALELKGARYNKLYIDDGNNLDYYTGAVKKNDIVITDKETPVQIVLKDFNENISKVNFTLKPSNPVEETLLPGIMTKPHETEYQENIMKLSVKTCLQAKEEIEIWQRGKSSTLSPNYKGKNQQVYLIDLRQYLPDSISTCQGTIDYSLQDRIPSETDYTYYSDIVDIDFPDHALYDTTYLAVSYDSVNGKESFKIGSRLVPLHQSMTVTLKPQVNYTVARNLGVYRKEGNSYSYLPAEWKNNRITFSSREFGEFVIQKDTLPPTIIPLSVNQTSARLKIRDGLSGISYFEASINGEWLLMVYDYKTGYLKSEKLDKSKLLKGEFELKVVDNAGNEKIYKQKIL